MREIRVHEQLFVDCLDLKIKKRIIRSSKKLKNTGIFIYEDFCKDTMDLRKQLWEKVLEHRANNEISI